MKKKRPNILLFLVDELRYPTVYDGPVLRDWMRNNLRAQTALRENGIDFRRHYVQSAACAPSRTSIFTGQYPSLHGVSQTDGIGKQNYDPGMFWLDPDMVPTMGDWFRAAGYRTHYRGKWHISHADILIPGTHNALLSNTDSGESIVENTDLYRRANRLDKYGFDGWIGPEPHGRFEANSGWRRDPLYAREALALLDRLDEQDSDEPWLIVNSYVNPHDIVFFGIVWKSWGLPYPTDAQVPPIPPPPTQNEDLSTKPRCQQSYVDTYPQMFLPQPTVDLYRQFYYFLQIEAENHVYAVYERLLRSRFAEDTIIVFTSDHGEMLGAHGGMHQKWYQAYEETIHVPLIISGKPVTEQARNVDALTSHADLLPTLLGLAGIDAEGLASEVRKTHEETRRLVGRNLAPVVRGDAHLPPGEPVYFMTIDDVAQGLNQITGNRQWHNVLPPNQVEAIVVELDGVLWKYVHYSQEVQTYQNITNPAINQLQQIYTSVEDQYEQYKLGEDPTEVHNLAWPGQETPESIAARPKLEAILAEQRELKRLSPIVNTGAFREQGEGALVTGPLSS
ncbi:MAG: sulfatase-like hydrolase/transferase [Acidobacteria bacterium]|nr:sulfatase-like hydrolase/transferase [Acidobacteriota bacterium]